jgi:PEGA domain-containing protein
MLCDMVRIVVAALLLVFGGTAIAGKPKIAILGLEVRGDKPDAKTIELAKTLTEGLRSRAKAGTGPFTLAPGSDKDLAELKLLSNCDNEAVDCMAAIGKDLAADWLLYGNVQANKQVTVRLLDVAAKRVTKTFTDIYAGDGTGVELLAFAKRIYAKLTGGNGGNLVVKANVERGVIYLEGQIRANLTQGLGRVVDLPEGKYKLAVEAERHLRYEQVVTIVAGEDTMVTVALVRSKL